VEEKCRDPRVLVLRNPVNLGVGGAVLAGFKRALADGADILVKIDGDGQMDLELLPLFVKPIAGGRADYAKGNRFHNPADVAGMPLARLAGNAGLSFMTKLSSGYWNIFDPTNGYVALSARVAALLPLDKIARRYFFETDMLFRLNLLRAVVVDIPMRAVYGDESSSLRIPRILGPFLLGHLKNAGKRIFYNYFLRDLTAGSLELLAGALLIIFGLVFGFSTWAANASEATTTASGTLMLAALPIIFGLQFLLAFLSGDNAAVPTEPLQGKI
jgi:glycosyltransferase involved in cell wall biosynthesis